MSPPVVGALMGASADRLRHAWLKQIDRAAVDLGSGKRMLVKEGRFDPTHQITVPKDMKDMDETR